MDRDQLADFLRHRRAALQPEDVGIDRGRRRRIAGLRREEVAALCAMSTDYYMRLEQRRGPQPSEAMLASIARGLRLTSAERDHLFRLAGHTPPPLAHRSMHVSRSLMRVLDRLDTPAQVMSDLGVTLAQNTFAVALLGPQTEYEGMSRSIVYRWFTDPAERQIYPEADHAYHSRFYAASARAALARHGDDPEATELVDLLLERSDEFAAVWSRHEVAVRIEDRKRMVHPTVGTIELECEVLVADNQAQLLLVYTATPGTEDAEKLRLLSVIGNQSFGSSRPRSG